MDAMTIGRETRTGIRPMISVGQTGQRVGPKQCVVGQVTLAHPVSIQALKLVVRYIVDVQHAAHKLPEQDSSSVNHIAMFRLKLEVVGNPCASSEGKQRFVWGAFNYFPLTNFSACGYEATLCNPRRTSAWAPPRCSLILMMLKL